MRKIAEQKNRRLLFSVCSDKEVFYEKWCTTLTVMHHFPLTSETVRTVSLLTVCDNSLTEKICFYKVKA